MRGIALCALLLLLAAAAASPAMASQEEDYEEDNYPLMDVDEAENDSKAPAIDGHHNSDDPSADDADPESPQEFDKGSEAKQAQNLGAMFSTLRSKYRALRKGITKRVKAIMWRKFAWLRLQHAKRRFALISRRYRSLEKKMKSEPKKHFLVRAWKKFEREEKARLNQRNKSVNQTNNVTNQYLHNLDVWVATQRKKLDALRADVKSFLAAHKASMTPVLRKKMRNAARKNIRRELSRLDLIAKYWKERIEANDLPTQKELVKKGKGKGKGKKAAAAAKKGKNNAANNNKKKQGTSKIIKRFHKLNKEGVWIRVLVKRDPKTGKLVSKAFSIGKREARRLNKKGANKKGGKKAAAPAKKGANKKNGKKGANKKGTKKGAASKQKPAVDWFAPLREATAERKLKEKRRALRREKQRLARLAAKVARPRRATKGRRGSPLRRLARAGRRLLRRGRKGLRRFGRRVRRAFRRGGRRRRPARRAARRGSRRGRRGRRGRRFGRRFRRAFRRGRKGLRRFGRRARRAFRRGRKGLRRFGRRARRAFRRGGRRGRRFGRRFRRAFRRRGRKGRKARKARRSSSNWTDAEEKRWEDSIRKAFSDGLTSA